MHLSRVLDSGLLSAHLGCMIDWEDLAQRQIIEIQGELPESIRVRAMEVPVFFSRARGNWLGVFQGYSLMAGPPTLPDEMPRITLFVDTLAEAASYRRTVFLREVRKTYLHELGHYFGWSEEQIANVGLA
jgi:predicted Zn-dependent protease with MMP-like domain